MDILQAVLLTAILYLLFALVHPRGVGKSLPPGPEPQFIAGNAFQLPKDRPWLRLSQWSGIYGELLLPLPWNLTVLNYL